MLGKKKKKGLDNFTRKLMEKFDEVYESDEYKERRKMMNRHLKQFMGNWWDKDMDDNESRIMTNYVFSTIQATAPLLTDNKPIISIRAKRPEEQGIAEMYDFGAKYWWELENMDHKLYEVVVQMLLWPAGLMKLYWDYEKDNICAYIDDPRDFVIAPGYTDLWGCAWCGTKMRKPISWVKSVYPDADIKAEEVNSENITENKKSGEYVWVYEIWTKDEKVEKCIINEGTEQEKEIERNVYENGRIVTFTPDVVLSDRPSPYEHGKPPWIVFYDYTVPHHFWGMGEPQQIEELNNEFNMRMQALVKHAQKTANKNYTLDSGSGLDPDDVKKTIAEGGNVYSINPGMQDAITPIDEGNLNPVHFNLMQMIPQLIEEVSGVTDISKGIASKKQRQSATEATVLIESSYTRTRQRVRNLEWALKRMFRIVVQIMMQFYDEPKSVSGRTGSTTEWQMVGNSKDMAIDATKPAPMPREQTEQYEERAMQDQDVMHVMKAFDPVDPVYIDFDIELQTNSTLPTDQQARANQMLRLAEVQLTPNSIIDGEAVLDALRIPNKEEILQRKEKERQQAMMMQQQAAQQGVNQ